MVIGHRDKIYALDVLRSFAVIGVVLYHYSWFAHPLESTFLRRGYIGVDIFFIISGFLACHTTKNLPASLGSSINYLLLRIVRIYPAYLIITLSYFFTSKVLDLSFNDLSRLLKSIMLLPQSSLNGPSYGAPVLDVGWTLNYEFFFTS